MAEPRRYWLKINDQAMLRFDEPLNPGFVFWLRRKFRARVHSEGGERVVMTRKEPFSASEMQELYSETDYRQQRVSTALNPARTPVRKRWCPCRRC
ncbi:U exon [Fowl aviadenovirus C]|uniref:U exon n=4 Tax=Fowl aviadenovirus C TaxID=190063 RepID=H8WQW7_9ADEN|nr:U-exon protein [Fowl aviadenovirus C]ANG08830.1 U exon protein [Fowl aviadenovirus 4]QJZ28081.1 U-exon protein [Fowl aviadenovirus 10]UVW56787.1 U-exon protein [Fowl adenovirus]AIS19801.1 U-exon protein [Fowl aviadenovirus C]AMB36777.1 U-exon protein [Fowl aviadenovirus C]